MYKIYTKESYNNKVFETDFYYQDNFVLYFTDTNNELQEIELSEIIKINE